jgi:hypothetical protein
MKSKQIIEFTKKESSESEHDYLVFVDGVRVESGYAFQSFYDKTMHLSLYENDDSERLASHSFAELPLELEDVKLTLDLDWPELVLQAEVSRGRDDPKVFQIKFKFEFNYENWKGPYSFAEYANAVHEALDRLEVSNIKWEADELLANGFSLRFPVRSNESSIIDQISQCSVILNELADAASETLVMESADSSLVVSFDFPEEIRIPCEQYLVYFVQFLKDLGVDATSNLEHRAGRVLFSVTPTDEKDALDKIRETLELYLHFPSSPFGNTDNESIAVQRLESNVLHLRSELKLAAAEVQAKNATIQAQQLTIDVQKRLLNGVIMVDSIKNVTPKPEDKESLLGGVVALATLKEKGVEINWGELFRKLRNKFAKK